MDGEEGCVEGGLWTSMSSIGGGESERDDLEEREGREEGCSDDKVGGGGIISRSSSTFIVDIECM